MHLIETLQQLEGAAEALAGCDRFYLDTEFESSRAGKRLSLIQLSGERASMREAATNEASASAPGGQEQLGRPSIFIVDALRLSHLQPLKPILGRAGVEWVLHAGLQDVELLLDTLSLAEPPRLFDTQIAWGLLGPEAAVSLAYLEFRVLGIRKMKTHQADDWLRRPLPKAQLEYAAHDVLHLPAIAQELRRRVAALQRAAIVEQASRAQLLPEPETVDPLSLESFRNAWQLEPRNLAALLAMIEWYNEEPERSRLAPKVFLSIASRLPRSEQDLMRIKGVPAQFVSRYGREFLRHVQARVAAFESRDEAPMTPPAYASYRELLLEARLWLMRALVCEKLSVAAELALPNKLLRTMHDRILATGDWTAALGALRGWREPLLAAEVGACLEREARESPL